MNDSVNIFWDECIDCFNDIHIESLNNSVLEINGVSKVVFDPAEYVGDEAMSFNVV